MAAWAAWPNSHCRHLSTPLIVQDSKSAYILHTSASLRDQIGAISFTSARKGARTGLGKHVSIPALDKLTSGTGRFWKTTRTGTAVVTS